MKNLYLSPDPLKFVNTLLNFFKNILLFIIFSSSLLYSATCDDLPGINGTNSSISTTTEVDILQSNITKYYKFQTTVDGSLNMTIDKYGNSENVKFSDNRCDGNKVYQKNDANNVNETFPITANTTYYIKLKEKNTANTLKFKMILNFTAANTPPVANAGADQTITEGDDVTLDGSSSTDSDGTITSYSWSDGTSNWTGVSPTVSGLTVGTHTITLTVTDNDSAIATDTVDITVAAIINEITSFTAPSEVTEGEAITVTVSYNVSETREIVTGFQQNHDPWDGWGWTTVTVPAGVGTVDISVDIPTGQTPGNTYQIPIILQPIGGNWNSRLDNKAQNPVNLIANQPPTATPQSISVDENSTNNAITLTGDDPDGDNSALTYAVVTAPSRGTLSCSDCNNPTYTPTAGYHGADSFTFKVNDGTDDSSVATVSITVTEALTIVENADDLCYNEIDSSGMMCIDMGICSGGIGCKNSIPLENIGDGVLSNISVLYDESGGMGGSFGGNCGVDPSGTCQTTSGIDMGPVGMMGQVTEFNLTDPMPIGDDTQSVWAKEFMSGQCFGQENIYATYIKDGVEYRGEIKSCQQDFTCANPRPYTKVYGENTWGEVDIIGNSVVCQNNSGSCGDPGDTDNNKINMMFINVDNDNSTFNHSSAEMDLTWDSSESKILWAGLYWQGMFAGPSAQELNDSQNIKLKVPGGNYIDLSSDRSKYNWVWLDEAQDRYMYQGFTEITSLIPANPNGTYSVANLLTETGKPAGGSYGAWSIVVAYYNPSLDMRNLTIFDGFQGIMPGGNGAKCSDRRGDPAKACNFAQNNGCSIDLAATGVANPVTVTLDGFYTPKENTVESDLIFYSGEGDRSKNGDTLSLTNSSGTAQLISDAQNPSNNVQNATISKHGVQVKTLEPQATLAGGTPWLNSLGADIDIFDIDGMLDNEQLSTDITMKTSGDGYFPGVFGFSTVLYEPKFCYDYAYTQLGKVYTEENNGSQIPRVKAKFVSSNAPIEVAVYIRNEENSDVVASNLSLNIQEINTTQAQYISDTTAVTYPNNVLRTDLTDSHMTSTDIDHVQGIPIGTVEGTEYFWTYIDLNPQRQDIDFPLNAVFSYDISLPNPSGNGYFTFSTSSILGKNMPMCSTSNFDYLAGKSIFNIAQKDLYENYNLYNLPTQVTNRVDNFIAVSYDPVNIDTENNISSIIGIELFDAGKYHDFNASCFEPDSAITSKIWLEFENNTSRSDFTRSTIQNAINTGMISDQIIDTTTDTTSAEDFFSTARENVGFRISYNVDANESIVQWERSGGTINILNYPEVIGIVGSTCNTAVQITPNGGTFTANTVDACGATGNAGLDDYGFARCMECIFGNSSRYICSRDNFSIRPEAFNIVIKDSNSSSTNIIGSDRSGIQNTPNPDPINLASGYSYKLDINATNHIDNNKSNGYIVGYGFSDSDYNLSLNWDPDSNTINPFCNDTNDSTISFNMINGIATDVVLKHSQVGQYNFKMIDTDWTKVDWNPNYTSHHTGAGFSTGKDCEEGLTTVPDISTATPYVNSNDLKDVAGCTISSNHDQNNTLFDTYYKYRDYNITFHPYKFLLNNLQISHGTDHNTTFGGAGNETYIYMSSFDNDNNMSLNSIGTISAAGYDDTVLSNYVNNCYAEDVNISLELNNTLPTCNVNLFGYNFINLDINNNPITDINRHFSDDGLTSPIITLSEGNFTKELNGTMNVVINYNYDKNTTSLRLNPKRLELDGFKIGCNNIDQCMINADQALYDYNGSIDSIGAINFVQGRVHAPRYRINGNDGNVTFYYEVYWDGNVTCNLDNLFPTLPPLSVDSINWYQNTRHTANDGNITSILKHRGSQSTVMSTKVNFKIEDLHYYETEGYPYKTIMDINASPWLIYHRYDNNATVNPFDIEFNQKGTVDDNAPNMTNDTAEVNSNRRIMW